MKTFGLSAHYVNLPNTSGLALFIFKYVYGFIKYKIGQYYPQKLKNLTRIRITDMISISIYEMLH